ncbi:hypothetical protein [Mycobacterium simiae]|uniref:Uncharacterized protein n=1 Tax=Mycobacterium simiae TaxID=1784 RepID=A0A1X0YFR7_MYCSI|nr:hypothetical protein [Mycobacterium simiae]ORJ63960.1 hypothetical protein B5M45_01645 [Mycobacterium simiae]
MPFTVVFSNGEPRDYGVFDKYQVTDAGVLVIDMHRADVKRHYIAPGSWLELVEMADDKPASASRGVLGVRP